MRKTEWADNEKLLRLCLEKKSTEEVAKEMGKSPWRVLRTLKSSRFRKVRRVMEELAREKAKVQAAHYSTEAVRKLGGMIGDDANKAQLQACVKLLDLTGRGRRGRKKGEKPAGCAAADEGLVADAREALAALRACRGEATFGQYRGANHEEVKT